MNISEQASIKGDPQQVVSLMHTLLDECPVQSDLAQSDEGDAQRLCAADQGAAVRMSISSEFVVPLGRGGTPLR